MSKDIKTQIRPKYSICIHQIKKYTCNQCRPSTMCIHGSHKYICKQCKGKGICIHQRRRYYCKDCNGKGICKHNRAKQKCCTCRDEEMAIVLTLLDPLVPSVTSKIEKENEIDLYTM